MGFHSLQKMIIFSILSHFEKILDFKRLLQPNHLDLLGISRDILSISFFWCLVVLCMTNSLVTNGSQKVGRLWWWQKYWSFSSIFRTLRPLYACIHHSTRQLSMTLWSNVKKCGTHLAKNYWCNLSWVRFCIEWFKGELPHLIFSLSYSERELIFSRGNKILVWIPSHSRPFSIDHFWSKLLFRSMSLIISKF